VTQTERLINCANCGRPVREADVGDPGWCERVDGDGVRSHVCPLCDRFGSRVGISSRAGAAYAASRTAASDSTAMLSSL
jgi:hypothetical protein